jgi:hypothetical protein
MVPPIQPEELDVDVVFEEPKPMISRVEEISNIRSELELGTMTMKQAIKQLHPNLEHYEIEEVMANRVMM